VNVQKEAAAEYKSDWEIARAANMLPIEEVAAKVGIPPEAVEPYGRTKAKISYEFIRGSEGKSDGKLILVTAISPTPAGEGKTTTTVGLGDALNRIGEKAVICLREPSLGPCFGMKGGAAGGGYAQIVPMDEINLHFTGDFHAITSANNLLAALIDNHIHWGNKLQIDPRRVTWRRAIDMNDRALRKIVSSLGGPANGVPREDGFDITVASEIMAILCLATSLDDLTNRLGDMVIGTTAEREPVRVRQLDAQGAMTALLKDALKPNLVQTLENNPAFVHGGPFANIAHGCNAVIATRLALTLGDYVVTEAGFGADLGAEKFFDIKCRQTGLKPDLAVLVATIRALKFHGGVEKADLSKENVAAVEGGMPNIERHIGNLRKFGMPVIVAINRFPTDTEAELEAAREACGKLGATAIVCEHWARGGAGAEALARAAVEQIAKGEASFRPLYGSEVKLVDKIRTVAREIYGAADIEVSSAVRKKLKDFEEQGFGEFPVCMAKTQYSFSAEPDLRGAPSGFTLPISDVRVSAGAGFIVALCGDIMTMPGLPRRPAAEGISVKGDGEIVGLS
jgi:formate--tetrahydrofolate ligase